MNNHFELSSAIYNKNEKAWQKSTSEISAFILKHLKISKDFFEFICGQEIDEAKADRWQQRLHDLLVKAQKRAGYQIDEQTLLLAARQHLVDRINSGELGESRIYKKFIELDVEDFKLKIS
ncbi:hypothetical protein JXE04_03080 [Patescibacteria group bacterium]|nr:hypothetical protein [Patescibacteria group bacterium]